MRPLIPYAGKDPTDHGWHRPVNACATNATRQAFAKRDAEIARRHASGEDVRSLAAAYGISVDRVRDVIRAARNATPKP